MTLFPNVLSISWLEIGDQEITDRLLHYFRQYGIKFRSLKSFRKVGWNSDPLPRIERFYKLENGRSVPHSASFIWDLREAIMYDHPLFLTSILLWRKLQKYSVDCIGGMESSAIPLIAGVLMINNMQNGRPLKSFFLRRERKPSGLRRLQEGARIAPGTRVVIIDDVFNKGIVKKRVTAYCSKNGFEIEGILVAVDAQSPNRHVVSNGCPVEAILTKADILSNVSPSSGGSTLYGHTDHRLPAQYDRTPNPSTRPAIPLTFADPKEPRRIMSPEDIELVTLVRDTVCITATSQGNVRPEIGQDQRGSSGYLPFLGRYLEEKGPVFVRISKREFKDGRWVNRMRGCQCKGLMGEAPRTFAEMAVASAIITATASRTVQHGPIQMHKPIWTAELGSLSYFVYIVEGLIPTSAQTAAELESEGHNVREFGLIGISADGQYRGVMCGDLDNVPTVDRQLSGVCSKAQNAAEVKPHQLSQMRFVRMRGRWIFDPQRPKESYF